jgi:hypothetical protein
VEGIGHLFASESTACKSPVATNRYNTINSHQQSSANDFADNQRGTYTDSLATATADIFARDGHYAQLWSLPEAFLTILHASDVNRLLNDITLQVLTTRVSHMSSRLRHLIVGGVANGNGKKLRKIYIAIAFV